MTKTLRNKENNTKTDSYWATVNNNKTSIPNLQPEPSPTASTNCQEFIWYKNNKIAYEYDINKCA